MCLFLNIVTCPLNFSDPPLKIDTVIEEFLASSLFCKLNVRKTETKRLVFIEEIFLKTVDQLLLFVTKTCRI